MLLEGGRDPAFQRDSLEPPRSTGGADLGGRSYDTPVDAVAARFALLLTVLGFVRTKTMKAFPEAAYRGIVASLG